MASVGGARPPEFFAASVLLAASSAAPRLLGSSLECAASCALSGAALDPSSCQQRQEEHYAARALATLAAEQVALLDLKLQAATPSTRDAKLTRETHKLTNHVSTGRPRLRYVFLSDVSRRGPERKVRRSY